MTIAEIVQLALLGAVLGLDVVSFPQMMISRPLVAATIAGAMVGEVGSGMLAGVVLELFALETLPFGASRYPEWGSASVVGGAIFAAEPDPRMGGLAVAILGALAAAWVSGHSMVWMRRLSADWARRHRASLDEGSYPTVVGLQLFGLTVDLVRGGLLTLAALLVLTPLLRVVGRFWGLDGGFARAVVVGLAATVAARAAWQLFHSTPRARLLFVGGLGVGFAFLLAR